MTTRDLANEATVGALKAGAGAGAAAWNVADGQIAMSIAVGAATVIYLVIQVGYLVWKWRRNSKLQGMVP
jgi:hypothetical protein